jgi:riboflavin kinase/FMN adenylyltransferase
MSCRGPVVTIGVFDGVHIGHRAVIKEAIRLARARRLKSVVVTFDPHPLKVIRHVKAAPSLISLEHRIALLKALGADSVQVIKFDRKMASMSAERFVNDILVKRLDASMIVVGEDFCLGKGASCDTRCLERIAGKYSIGVKAVRHLKKNGRVVSSTAIRRLVVAGNIAGASSLLGRPFSIFGTVVSGAKLARSLGYPTANINPHHEAIPPSGVYAVKVTLGGRGYNGVLNIGVKPTFYDHGRDKEPLIEAHIFGFRKRIYGRNLEITFVRRLRAERKFKTIDSLISQIKRDEREARRILLHRYYTDAV